MTPTDPGREELDPPAQAHVQEFLERYGAARGGHQAALPLATYFADLDSTLGGLPRGELSLLAARPATGATTLSLSICRNLAVIRGQPVAYDSTTLAPLQLVERLVIGLGKLPALGVQLGFLTRSQERRLREAAESIAAAPLHLAQIESLGLNGALERWAWLRREHDVSLFVLDGLSHLARSGEHEAGPLCRRLREAARELEAHVLVLGPLRQRAERKPQPDLGDLWGGMDLELAADKVLLLSRDQDSGPATSAACLRLRVVKNESGATGEVQLSFRPKLLRLESAVAL